MQDEIFRLVLPLHWSSRCQLDSTTVCGPKRLVSHSTANKKGSLYRRADSFPESHSRRVFGKGS